MTSYKHMFFVINSLCCLAIASSYHSLTTNVSYSRTSRQVRGCILPQHPRFGQWMIYQSVSQPQVGSSVSSGTVLQISCQNGYKLDGDAVIVCLNGEWNTDIGQCMKTCPPIYNTPVMTVTCTYNHRKLKDCVNALDGTKAEFRCANFYEDHSLERHPRHVCYNGRWSNSLPECVPICGQKNVKKDPTLIVGGANVTRGDYPWQVALYHKQSKNLLCGGSLLNQKVVLTAAHCITDSLGNLASKDIFMVAVGKYYRNYDDIRDKNGSQFSSIYDMYIPKQYKGDAQNYFGDIALIITKKTFVLSIRVQPVCVDWGFRHDYLLNPLKTSYAYVSGWGYTVQHKNPSEVLRELRVPLITEDKCNERLPEEFTKFLTDDKICAGYLESGLSVCKGDSGGGLVARYRDRFYVIAVVSVSPQAETPEGGCDSQTYALYTRVNYYIDSFILDIEARFRQSFLSDLDCEGDTNCKTGTSTTPQTVVQTPNQFLECGRISAANQAGTTIRSPWHVTLYERRSKKLICNGALINQRAVVTAAQCVTTLEGKKKPKEDLIVAVGKYYSDFDNSKDTEAQFSDMEDIFLPEHYKGLENYFIGDIAVIVTKTPFKLSQKVQPICIDWGLTYDINSFGNGYISGWEPNSVLKLSNKHSIIKNEQCSDALTENCERLFLTFDKICVGFLNDSSSRCKSDDGVAGAALVTNHQDKYYLAGIASIIPRTADGDCDRDKSALFTKVSFYTNSLLEIETLYRTYDICQNF